MSQQAVQIAGKLYATRDAMRTLLGDKYAERVREHVRHIQQFMLARQCDELDAVLQIASAVVQQGDNPGIIFAAYVEMSEGASALSKPTTSPATPATTTSAIIL